MNLKEFAALKVGDKITNDMASSQGEVTEVYPMGVRVRWGDNHVGSQIPTFTYTVNSTAWFHWSKVDNGHQDEAAPAGAPTA